MKVLELVKELISNKEMVSSKIKVKEFSKSIYPSNTLYYLNENMVDGIDYKIINFKREVEEPEIEIVKSEEISLEKLNIITKADWTNLFVSANLYNDTILEVETIYGFVRPVYFPREDSNIGVYTNRKLKTSYVNDGRLAVVGDRMFVISSTQMAIEKFFRSRLEKNEEKRKSLNNFITEEYFPRENEEGEIPEKSIVFIGETDLMEFPQMGNGEPYNRGWGFGFNLFEAALSNKELRQRMRFSSLSQNGETAFIGHISKDPVSIKIDGTITNSAYEVEICNNEFVDSNAKLDISATQGVKSCFKTVNVNKEVLVVLCELWDRNNIPLNINGNCVCTPKAFDTYKTVLTQQKSNESGIIYPAHKVFAYKGKEVIRAKGACSVEIFRAYPVDNPKDVIDAVVAFPPREIKHEGVEEDLKKFTSLSEGKELHKYIVEYDGNKFECYGIKCKVSEDPLHSSVYSIKNKSQNHDYYGAQSEIYRNNGFDGLVSHYEERLDHTKLMAALNVCGLELCEIEEVDIDNFNF